MLFFIKECLLFVHYMNFIIFLKIYMLFIVLFFILYEFVIIFYVFVKINQSFDEFTRM